MANEIVKIVAKKANITEPIAKIAVDTVLKVLKDKLPSSLGNTIDSFLGSATASGKSVSKSSKTASSSSKTTAKNSKKSDNPLGDLGGIAGAFGGLLGKK